MDSGVSAMLEGAKAIALDFDGTIIESVGIKDQAFEQLFSGYQEHWDAIWAYHKAHDAVIRFDKFRHICEEILGEVYTEELKNDWSQRFRSSVVAGLVSCPYVEGALEFLKIYEERVPLFLMSISPEDELNDVLRERGLISRFARVFAHPWKKVDALKLVMEEGAFLPQELLFVGDSPEDYSAASISGVPFIGRFSGKEFPANVRCVNHLGELLDS